MYIRGNGGSVVSRASAKGKAKAKSRCVAAKTPKEMAEDARSVSIECALFLVFTHVCNGKPIYQSEAKRSRRSCKRAASPWTSPKNTSYVRKWSGTKTS